MPGSGAVSTSRAGAAVASADDGEALSLNPAGLAKVKGTVITLSAALINYSMKFTRTGTYDELSDDMQPYEGTAYATVENKPKPPLGLGSTQPVPVAAVITDLGGRVPGLRLAFGLYAPNAYPFRNMSQDYAFNGDFTVPPPPTRYDIVEQDAAFIIPSLGIAYQVTPQLDVGVRLSWGIATLKSTVALWADPDNYEENVKKDGLLTADATDSFVPMAGLGVNYRPTPNLELAVVYNTAAAVHAQGTAVSAIGPSAGGGIGELTIHPVDDASARCAPGGTIEAQKACIQLQLPMNATLGARYKFLDAAGALKGDLELNVGWENWGRTCDFIEDPDCTSPGTYRVVVDAEPHIGPVAASQFRDSVVEHGLQDTYSVRLGGSYHLGLGAAPGGNQVILRGGVGYDTRAAKDGWLRADLDGAARVTLALGAAYRTRRFELSVGGGYIHEGKNTNSGTCNPTPGMEGCRTGGGVNPIDERRGPDPINPLLNPENQRESPVNQGTIESSYLLFMLGASTWF